MLSEVSPAEEDKCRRISLRCEIPEEQRHKKPQPISQTENRLVLPVAAGGGAQVGEWGHKLPVRTPASPGEVTCSMVTSQQRPPAYVNVAES